jgi:hypothetical protein
MSQAALQNSNAYYDGLSAHYHMFQQDWGSLVEGERAAFKYVCARVWCSLDLSCLQCCCVGACRRARMCVLAPAHTTSVSGCGPTEEKRKMNRASPESTYRGKVACAHGQCGEIGG